MAGKTKISEWLRSRLISTSIIKTIKTSHIVIIALLLIPLMLSIVVTFFNTISYDRLITNADKTNQINQIVKTDITNELWDIVAGNKTFYEGDQYRIIGHITSQLDDIMSTTRGTGNRQVLEVTGRALKTLTRYVDRLDDQMEQNFPVIENERILDEIRGVTTLVSELLQDFIVREIESAAVENHRIKTRAIIIGTVEFGIVVLAVLFSAFVRMSAAKSVDKSIGSLVSLSSSIAKGNLDARAEVPHIQELKTLARDLNIMARKIKTLIDENIREQRNLQKSEMKALQAQITPHFLYNTLDSIVWLAEGNQNEQVISITRAFSNFFRISLNRGSEWVRVRDEFKHIESYLTIQKIRYRDILDYSIEYERDMEEKIMLKLLLQPLVENALYHGIKNKRGRGSITVTGRRKDGFMQFCVADNGIGITTEQLAGIKERLVHDAETSGYGLYNVERRLELYYNRTGLLDIHSVYRGGTEVTLLIPDSDEYVMRHLRESGVQEIQHV
jgi:two-component system sensor histidine kinase YesM